MKITVIGTRANIVTSFTAVRETARFRRLKRVVAVRFGYNQIRAIIVRENRVDDFEGGKGGLLRKVQPDIIVSGLGEGGGSN